MAGIRRQLTKVLSGFEKERHKDKRVSHLTYRPSRQEFPVPELVLFALRNVMGFDWDGPGEKCAWWVMCSFKGLPISFENRKMGFAICYADDPQVDIKRIVGQLRSAIAKVEKFLEPVAKQQVESGNVTIANEYTNFTTRYRFFRNLADTAYNAANAPPSERVTNVLEGTEPDSLDAFTAAIESLNRSTAFQCDGFYHSTAMIDVFFSRLEHMLILLRAFTGRPLAHGELLKFLTSRWDEKFKSFVDVKGDANAQKCYTRLKNIKEKIRNPLAHGGMENDGSSLYIHLPTIGALPATFTKVRNSAQFNLIPIEHEDHNSICELFDEVDRILSAGSG